MKIALCFYGRFGKKNISKMNMNDKQRCSINDIWSINHYKKYVIQNYDVDVFFHCWNEENKNFLVKYYNPKSYLFEKQTKEQKEWVGNFIKNSPRFVSEQKSLELVLNYENKNNFKYDFIFHTIFDQLFFTKINFKEMDNKYIYTSIRYMKNDPKLKKPINEMYDQWYIGTSDNLKKITGSKISLYFKKYPKKKYGSSHIQRYKLAKDLGLLDKSKFILYPGSDHVKIKQIFCPHYIHCLKKIIN